MIKKIMICDTCNPEGFISGRNGRGYADADWKTCREVFGWRKIKKGHECHFCIDEKENNHCATNAKS